VKTYSVYAKHHPTEDAHMIWIVQADSEFAARYLVSQAFNVHWITVDTENLSAMEIFSETS